MTENANVKAPDPVDWSKYQDGGAGKPLPPDGEYALEVVAVNTTADDNTTLLRSREGYFQPTYDVKVIAPGAPHDGYLSRFNRANTKKWAKREGCPLGDLLRGAALKGPFTTDAEYQAAVKSLQGRRINATMQWEIYDSSSGFQLSGMDSFPLVDGVRQTKVIKDGNTFYANAKVRFVKSALAKG